MLKKVTAKHVCACDSVWGWELGEVEEEGGLPPILNYNSVSVAASARELSKLVSHFSSAWLTFQPACVSASR